MPGPANIKFRSTDSAALWLLCLTGETKSNILLLMNLYVIFDTIMETGVVIEVVFEARCNCYCSVIGLRLMPLSCRAIDAGPEVSSDTIIACSSEYLVLHPAASSAKVVGK